MIRPGDVAPAELVSTLHDALIEGYGAEDERAAAPGIALGSVM